MLENRPAWLDGVIPVGAGRVAPPPPCLYPFRRDCDPRLIAPFQYGRLDGHTRLRPRSPDTGQEGLQGAQRLASPVDADATKQAVVRRVPFRRPPRVVAGRHPQPPAVGQLL